jgi:hypothetical protein
MAGVLMKRDNLDTETDTCMRRMSWEIRMDAA